MSFNAMFVRVQKERERKARLEAERQSVDSAECAKQGIDPLDAFMPKRPDGSRIIQINETRSKEPRYRPTGQRQEGRGRSVNNRNLEEAASKVQRGYRKRPPDWIRGK